MNLVRSLFYIEEPKYEVVWKDEADNIEERKYPAEKWVCTDERGANWKDVSGVGFQKLFGYISGKNVDKAKINMTAPVNTTRKPTCSSTGDNMYTISFFIPSSLQDKPPQPLEDSSVYIKEWPEMSVYVRRYGGFTSDDQMLKELSLLKASLDKHNKAYTEDTIYAPGYDAPFKLINRRNEIWVMKADA